MDYAESRAYEPGDEVRHIDWRVTARTTKLHTKLFEEERERNVLLLVDLGLTMQFGTLRAFKAVAAAELAALIGWTAIRNGDRVGAVVCDGTEHTEVEPRASARGVLHVLHALVDADARAKLLLNVPPPPPETRPWAAMELLRRARRAARPGSSVQIVSDMRGPSAALESELRRIAAHCDTTLWFIYDPVEATAPAPGRYMIGDGLRAAVFDTHAPADRDRHDAQFERHRSNCEEMCKRYRVRFHALAAADMPETALSPLSLGQTTLGQAAPGPTASRPLPAPPAAPGGTHG